MIKIINLENLNKITKTYFDRIVEDRNEADKIWLHLNHLKNEMEQIYTSYSNIADKAIITGEIVDRLAEYEDTGLTPEEITALKGKIERGELVEVVRCKECNYYYKGCCSHGMSDLTERNPDDYCSFGERSVENEND